MNLPRASRLRRMSLTPMIDVVFLLLVFFMLAARFGQEGVIEIALAGSGESEYSGPPRLIDVFRESVALNGVAVPIEDLPRTLSKVMEAPSDMVVLRAMNEVNTQRMVEVLSYLADAGLTGLVLVE